MGQAAGVQGRLQASATNLSPRVPLPPRRGRGAYTKLKGLLVMRNSCFPWATRRLSTANVSSPRRMYFSGKYMGGEKRVVRASPAPAPAAAAGPSPLTHVPRDPLVHEALHVHVPNGILGAVEGQ